MDMDKSPSIQRMFQIFYEFVMIFKLDQIY